jgi:archaellum component FlaF (FlaF/FlaG flagellin family)
MEEVKIIRDKILGFAALITAIITFVLAVIPCVGLIAIIPGIIAIILASVGLSQAGRNNSPMGVPLAGLIIAIIASMISFSQIFVAGKIVQKADKWPNNIQNIINDVQDNVNKEIEDANVSIKVESNGIKVEINTNSNKKDQEQKLEDLEGGNTGIKEIVSRNMIVPETCYCSQEKIIVDKTRR